MKQRPGRRLRVGSRLPFALGAGLPVLAAVLADLTWDGRYLLIPAAWLIAATVLTTLLGHFRPGLLAWAVSFGIFVVVFVPPRWSIRMSDSSAIAASFTFTVMTLAITVVMTRLAEARHDAAEALSTLDAVLAHAPIGIAFLDRDLRFVRVNDALAEISGLPVSDYLGRDIEIVVDDPEVLAVARRVLDTGKAKFDVPAHGRRRSTGEDVTAVAGYYPVITTDGRIDGVGVIVRDITDATRAEAERDRLLTRVTRLQEVTAAFAAAGTTTEVVGMAVENVRRAVGAIGASLTVIDGSEVVVLGSHGYDPQVLTEWERFPLDLQTPLAEAIRSERIVLAGSTDEIRTRWPELGPSLQDGGRALAALPLVVDSEVVGAIGLSYDHDRVFDDGDESFFAAVATQCAQAMLRARLYESEQAARAVSEVAAERLSFLAEASATLASSLDWRTTLRQVTELAVPRLGDWCAVFVRGDDGSISALELAHVDPSRREVMRRVATQWAPSIDQEVGIGAVARTGQPILVNDVTPEQLAAAMRDADHLRTVLEVGVTSVLAVPMRVQSRILGVIAVATNETRRLGEDDLALASELATRAGQAMLNAQLFGDRTHVAETLQASLRPVALPLVPGLDLAARFFAVGHGIDVGGDFYDVFPMGRPSDGPASRWAVVIGDVRGKGVEAATVSGAARHAIRSAALGEPSPAKILQELNDVLLVMGDAQDDPRFCTAIVAAVQPADDSATVSLAVGGHPAPYVMRSDGSVEVVAGGGSLIGALPAPPLHDVEVQLGPGDALVLYTDGVTERHESNRFFDEEGLVAVLARCTGFTASVVAERLETAARAFVEDAPRDDMAILVVRVPEPTASATNAATDLAWDASAPRGGRRFVDAVLGALGFDGETTARALLLTSELVTNAVLHGSEPVRVAVEAFGDGCRVSVSDGSSVEPRRVQAGPADLNGRGVNLVATLARRWGVERTPTGKTVWFELPR